MRPQRVVFGLALFVVVLAGPRALADEIPWSYQWEASPAVVPADPPRLGEPSPGGISLTPAAIAITGGTGGTTQGSAILPAVTLSAFAFAPEPAGAPYRFTAAPYHLSLILTDLDTKTSRRLHFSGMFDGTFTRTRVDLHTRFTGPRTQCVVLGSNVYTASLSSYSPPGAPSDGGEGEIKAFVSVHAIATPEPSGLVLAGMGLVGALGAWWGRLGKRMVVAGTCRT